MCVYDLCKHMMTICELGSQKIIHLKPVYMTLIDAGIPRLNQNHLFVRYQGGSRGSSSTITSTRERRCEVPCEIGGNVRTLCRQGRLKEAVRLLDVMDQPGSKANSDVYICLLQGCMNMKALGDGKRVHAHILKQEVKPNTFLANTLVNMYSKCGSMMNARQVFDEMCKRNIFSWNIMIAGCVQHGHGEDALELFWQMEREHVKPNKFTYATILKACASKAALEQGKQVHALVMKGGFESDVFVRSALVDMYSKCGSIEHARQVFDEMPKRDIVSWNVMIAGYAQHGYGKEAFELFRQMEQEGVKPNDVTFVSMLKVCASLAALEQGKWIHAHIIKSGFESSVFVGSTLVGMYAKCKSIKHARQMFDKMPKRDVVSWNAMISGYAQHGHVKEVFELFQEMEQEGVKPNKVTFVSMLKACTSVKALEHVKQIHAYIVEGGFGSDAFVGSALVDMYAKCGSIEHARQVFAKMPKRKLFLWNCMLAGYAQHGHAMEALELFWQMEQEAMKPNEVTFVSILKACANLAALKQGKQIHAIIVKSGFQSDVFVGSMLVDMYAKCGSIKLSRLVFNGMPKRDVVSWNAMIAGYVQHRHVDEALELFWQMEGEHVKPNEVTFVSIIKACASVAALEQGKQIHAHIVKSGLEWNVIVGNSLIDMYGKCRSIDHACQVFNEMPKRDVVSWNAMIAGYAQHGRVEDALELFWQMEPEGVKPDKITISSILKACASVAALEQGKQIHALAIKSGIQLDTFLRSTLVDMYAKCGRLEQARGVFNEMSKKDVVSWTAMIAGYAHHGHAKEALELFRQMEWEGVKPNEVTFVSILKTCASVADLERGKQIHACIIESGFQADVYVGNTLVDMYSKCGSIEHAWQVFEEMPKREVVSWNAMISGYVQHGQAEHALELFQQMEREGMKPDKVTFVSIAKACASLTALEQGKQIHGSIIRSGFEWDVFVRTTLVDMYSKCGSIEHARNVFDEMPIRDAVLWNTMITGYAQHGHGKEVLQLVEQMQREGIKLDHVTFVCVLSACSHAGLVDEGFHYFDRMSRVHGITPTDEHYACMVDLLGRAGRLKQAEEFIQRMPYRPSTVIWSTLLGACRVHGNIELAKHAAESITKLEPQNTAAFVLLSNIYAAAGRWDDKVTLRKMLQDTGVRKKPGVSHIEVNDRTHAFIVKDTSHPQRKEILAELTNLSGQMEDAGYASDTRFVLHDVEEEQKDSSLCHHK